VTKLFACLSKKWCMYRCSVSPCSCLIHVGTRAPHGAGEVAGELGLELVSLVDRVLVE
jgi:hypothetical protein